MHITSTFKHYQNQRGTFLMQLASKTLFAVILALMTMVLAVSLNTGFEWLKKCMADVETTKVLSEIKNQKCKINLR